jgi:molybdenum cofactor cytidylyltransferase
MNNTKKAANWLAPTFLIKYFASTNKRHLIITGDRGCGKSTLLLNCLTPEYGFITKAKTKECIIYTDIASGESVEIGRYDPSLNKMVAVKQGFKMACTYLKRAILCGQVLYFDEIGYIERSEQEFLSLIYMALNTRTVYAVVRKCDESHINAIICRNDVCVVDLTTKDVKLGCVVMASGLSTRYGKNKLLEDLCGKYVAQYAVDNAIYGPFKKCLMLTRLPPVKAAFERQITCILHERPTRSGAIALAVENLADMDGIMFIQADQPLVSADSIANMAFAFRQNPTACFRLSYGDKQAAPTIFPKELFNRLLGLPEHKGGNFLFANGVTATSIYAQDDWQLCDIDTPSDLQMIKTHLT